MSSRLSPSRRGRPYVMAVVLGTAMAAFAPGQASAQAPPAAAELLSQRQQRILRLSFEGWSVHEISDELNLPPERVSDEKYKAIRKLRARLAGGSEMRTAAGALP